MTGINELDNKQPKKLKMHEITDPVFAEQLEVLNIKMQKFNNWMKGEITRTNKELENRRSNNEIN